MNENILREFLFTSDHIFHVKHFYFFNPLDLIL